MNKSFKVPQLLLCIIAAVGMFLPLISANVQGKYGGISFVKGSDDGKIILGIIVVAIIFLALKKENNKTFGVISLLLILGAGIFFWVDLSKISDAMTFVKYLSGNAIHYGIGYYMSLFGLLLSFILGVIELFSANKRSDVELYEDILLSQSLNNQNTSNISNNSVNSNPQPIYTLKEESSITNSNVINNSANNNVVNDTAYNGVKLADFVVGKNVNLDNNIENNIVNNVSIPTSDNSNNGNNNLN